MTKDLLRANSIRFIKPMEQQQIGAQYDPFNLVGYDDLEQTVQSVVTDMVPHISKVYIRDENGPIVGGNSHTDFTTFKVGRSKGLPEKMLTDPTIQELTSVHRLRTEMVERSDIYKLSEHAVNAGPKINAAYAPKPKVDLKGLGSQFGGLQLGGGGLDFTKLNLGPIQVGGLQNQGPIDLSALAPFTVGQVNTPPRIEDPLARLLGQQTPLATLGNLTLGPVTTPPKPNTPDKSKK